MMDPTPQIRVSGAEHESVSRTHVARKELDDVENQLAELKARRSLLQADVNATTDPLTRQIPLEIASYIFELFLMAHIAEEDWPYFLGQYIPFRLTKPAAPLRLAAVCKQWRNIAWSLPQLWTTLVVDLHCKHSALGPEIVSQWLMRTKNLPLVIKIGTFGGVQKCSECITANGQAIIRTINRHASQWRLLDFTSLPSGLLQELDDSKSAGMETPSLLQYLLLGDDSDLPNSNGIPTDQLLRLSKRNHCPTHLRIASSIPPSQINIQWTHLTHLELSFCTVPASLAIISSASISPLRSLALVNFFGPSDEWWALSRPVVLPDLLFLSIDDPTPAGLISQSILNCLEVPSLTSLHLARDTESESSGDLPVASIISLLGRSNCMLHYFTLIHWPVSDSALVQLLNKTPTLTTLTIDLHWTSDPLILLNRLSQADFTTSHDPFLPNLQTLDLTSPLPVSWTPLIGVFDCSPADISDANHLIQQAPVRRNLQMTFSFWLEDDSGDYFMDRCSLLKLISLWCDHGIDCSVRYSSIYLPREKWALETPLGPLYLQECYDKHFPQGDGDLNRTLYQRLKTMPVFNAHALWQVLSKAPMSIILLKQRFCRRPRTRQVGWMDPQSGVCK